MVFSIVSIGHTEKLTQENDAGIFSPKIDVSIADELNSTSMRFCIDGFETDKLSRIGKLTLQPGKSQDICMVFINNLPTDKEFTIGFSEWTINEWGNITCDQNMDNNKMLNMILDMPEITRKIMVASWSNTITHFKMKIPTTATGNIYGCVAYSLPNSYSKNTGDVFWMFIRKVAPIEITITWDVYTLWRWDDLKDVYTTNKNSILQIIVGILAIWIIISIVQTVKKKDKHHKKK